MKEKTEEG